MYMCIYYHYTHMYVDYIIYTYSLQQPSLPNARCILWLLFNFCRSPYLTASTCFYDHMFNPLVVSNHIYLPIIYPLLPIVAFKSIVSNDVFSWPTAVLSSANIGWSPIPVALTTEGSEFARRESSESGRGQGRRNPAFPRGLTIDNVIDQLIPTVYPVLPGYHGHHGFTS